MSNGLFELQPDLEALVVSAELKRDEYKRILDRIHTIALGCSTQNTIAYVELPGVIERIIAERHKQWERAIAAEARLCWHNTVDELPEFGVPVLFVWRDRRPEGIIGYGCFNADETWTDDATTDRDGEPETCRNVTHWMPLPETPTFEA